MAKGALQAKNEITIVRGGYTNEEHHPVGQYYDDWTNVGLPADDFDTLTVSGVVKPGYLYRDSDIARNSNSTAVTVSIEDHWKATRNLVDNTVDIEITTYLCDIKRHDKKGNPPAARRTLAAYKSYDNNTETYRGTGKVWGDYQDDSAHTTHKIKTGKTKVGTRTYSLSPGQKTSDVTDRATVYFWNHSTGYGYTEIYLDSMWMGLQFRNNLPKTYAPPTLTKIEQTPDICKYLVLGDFTFASNLPADSGDHKWYLDISLDSDYSDADTYTLTSDATTFTFADIELKPNQKYYWRIRLESDDAYTLSKAGTGSFDSLEIIPPNESVPEFSDEDCEQLTSAFPGRYSEWPGWKEYN